MINLSNFEFISSQDAFPNSERIPAGLKTKQELIEAISETLNFPDYFGENWDAFEECIRDLSWLSDDIILLEHTDFPMEGDDNSRRIYLEILSEAVEKWRSNENQRLRVLFPQSVESVVRRFTITGQ
jgi:RNAse (barnase) inhibitor barstar